MNSLLFRASNSGSHPSHTLKLSCLPSAQLSDLSRKGSLLLKSGRYLRIQDNLPISRSVTFSVSDVLPGKIRDQEQDPGERDSSAARRGRDGKADDRSLCEQQFQPASSLLFLEALENFRNIRLAHTKK